MKIFSYLNIILFSVLLIFSCSLSVKNDNNLDSVVANEISPEYSKFYVEIHKMLRENKINPSAELAASIDALEDEAYRKFPEYMIRADEVENCEGVGLTRDTTDRYVWEQSVRAVGSFGFATVWWTEPYVGSDFYRYKINRRHEDSSYYYNREISYDPNFDY